MTVSPQPNGRYRRSVHIRADRGRVSAAMEDDVHHFRISAHVEHGRVVDIQAEAIRTPWTMCPGAVEEVMALKGRDVRDILAMPLDERNRQCLHQFDLLLIALRHHDARNLDRLYRIEADHDRPAPQLTLELNGQELLAWDVDNGVISGSRFDGIALRNLNRALSDCDADMAEAALILRRASLISFVRRIDLDRFPNGTGSQRAPTCYAYQPPRKDRVGRNFGSTVDFWTEGRWPLQQKDAAS